MLSQPMNNRGIGHTAPPPSCILQKCVASDSKFSAL